MEHQSLHRMELAKQRVRKKLSIEYIRTLSDYRDINEEEYEKLIIKIETLASIIIDIYREKHMDENTDN